MLFVHVPAGSISMVLPSGLPAQWTVLRALQERLTLKHKNTSKWAKRALRRGINVMDEGTKEAMQEQLRLGMALRQKVCAARAPPDKQQLQLDTILFVTICSCTAGRHAG